MPKPVVIKLSTTKRMRWGFGGEGEGRFDSGHGFIQGNGNGCGLGSGDGTFQGSGIGDGNPIFQCFLVQGDDNLLGLFYAKASFLGDLPEAGKDAYSKWTTLVDWLKLARELGLEAKAVLKKEELSSF